MSAPLIYWLPQTALCMKAGNSHCDVCSQNDPPFARIRECLRIGLDVVGLVHLSCP